MIVNLATSQQTGPGDLMHGMGNIDNSIIIIQLDKSRSKLFQQQERNNNYVT